MTKWNIPETYKKGVIPESRELKNNIAVFTYREGERLVYYEEIPRCLGDMEEVQKYLCELDYEIITQVASSKYLTSLQIFQYMCMQGFRCNRPIINRHLHKLVKYQLLQEVELLTRDNEKGIRVYSLAFLGNQIAYKQGVCFHRGNKYISPKRKRLIGLREEAADIKKVLLANQILINLLKSKVQMKRFGIRETTRIINDNSYESGKIFRATLTVRLDEKRIFAYEVVRRNKDGLETVANKVTRFWKLVNNPEYIEANEFADKEHPRLIIAEEDFEHNKQIFYYLKDLGEYRDNEKHTIFFTEDLLNLQGNRKSLYTITADGKQVWYELPQ